MSKQTTRLPALALAAVLLGLLGGCSSDPTAPQDQTPQVTVADAAYQAGLVAFGVSQFGPKLLDPSAPTKDVVTIEWNGQLGLAGRVFIDFRAGANGDPAPAATATWAHLYTADGAPVVYTMQGLGGQTAFTLDVTAVLDHQADEAILLSGSGGTMTTGDYVVGFDVQGVVVGSTGYPSQGGMTVTSGTHSAEITFNGTSSVTMIVDQTETYFINLATGEVTQGVPV